LRLVALAIAALAGASMAVQGTLNSILGKKTGSFEAAFIVHVIGAVLLGVILLTGLSHGNLRQATASPWYAFLGGPLSVLIIWGVLVSVGRVGVSSANTAIVGAQIAVALVLDLCGASGQKLAFSWVKVLGAALFIAGAYLLLKQPPAAS
jgi:transporter family-2 protein